MKARDLMLGDWVYGIDGKGGKHPCRINTIDIYPQNRTPRVVTSGGYGYQQENLEPIPLTPEILEKNGFGIEKTCSCATVYWWGEKVDGKIYCNRTVEISFYPTPINGVDILTRIETSSRWGDGVDKIHSCDINYVHDLQHALRLCGIDKQIEL